MISRSKSVISSFVPPRNGSTIPSSVRNPDLTLLSSRIQRRFNLFAALETTQNLKVRMNSIQFMLNLGSHPNGGLQNDWKKAGPKGLDLRILEQIEYDKDESKTDYSEDLEVLKAIWIEKLSKEGIRFYNSHIGEAFPTAKQT